MLIKESKILCVIKLYTLFYLHNQYDASVIDDADF